MKDEEDEMETTLEPPVDSEAPAAEQDSAPPHRKVQSKHEKKIVHREIRPGVFIDRWE